MNHTHYKKLTGLTEGAYYCERSPDGKCKDAEYTLKYFSTRRPCFICEKCYKSLKKHKTFLTRPEHPTQPSTYSTSDFDF